MNSRSSLFFYSSHPQTMRAGIACKKILFRENARSAAYHPRRRIRRWRRDAERRFHSARDAPSCRTSHVRIILQSTPVFVHAQKRFTNAPRTLTNFYDSVDHSANVTHEAGVNQSQSGICSVFDALWPHAG